MKTTSVHSRILLLLCFSLMTVAQGFSQENLTVDGLATINKDLEALRLDGLNNSITFRNGSLYNAYLTHSGSLLTLMNRRPGSLALGTNTVTRMTINSNGNIGIGINSPSDRLEVAGGDIKINKTDPYLKFYDGSTFKGRIGVNGELLHFQAAGPTQYFDVNTNKLALVLQDFPAISSTLTSIKGHLRVNENSDGSAWVCGIDGNTIIRGNTQIRDNSLSIDQLSSTLADDRNGIQLFSASSSIWRIMHSGSYFSFLFNNDRKSYIEQDGDYIVVSDRRFKENIRPMENVLSKILLLQPARYNYKTSPSHQSAGFIAQEVQKLFPECVAEGEDGTLGIAYAHFGILAIKAIQEQQKSIDALQIANDQVTANKVALEQRVNSMEEKINELIVQITSKN